VLPKNLMLCYVNFTFILKTVKATETMPNYWQHHRTPQILNPGVTVPWTNAGNKRIHFIPSSRCSEALWDNSQDCWLAPSH
jgi:hypothetical protein